MGIKDIYTKIIGRKGTKESLSKNGKYFLSPDEEDIFQIINAEGKTVSLHRIVAKKDLIGGASGRQILVKKGEKGGFVQSEKNLSPTGLCWVYDDAIVHGNAKILDDAKIKEEAVVRDSATVSDKAIVSSRATIAGNAAIRGNARVGGQAQVIDGAVVQGFSRVKDAAMVCDNAIVSDFAQVSNNSIIAGNANVCGTTIICSSYQKQAPASIIFGDATIDTAFVYQSAVYGNAYIQGQYGVNSQSISKESQHELMHKYDVAIFNTKVGGNSVIQNICTMEENQGASAEINFDFSSSLQGIKISGCQIKDNVQIILDSANKVCLSDCCLEGGVKLDTSDNVELYAKTLTDQPLVTEEEPAQ